MRGCVLLAVFLLYFLLLYFTVNRAPTLHGLNAGHVGQHLLRQRLSRRYVLASLSWESARSLGDQAQSPRPSSHARSPVTIWLNDRALRLSRSQVPRLRLDRVRLQQRQIRHQIVPVRHPRWIDSRKVSPQVSAASSLQAHNLPCPSTNCPPPAKPCTQLWPLRAHSEA